MSELSPRGEAIAVALQRTEGDATLDRARNIERAIERFEFDQQHVASHVLLEFRRAAVADVGVGGAVWRTSIPETFTRILRAIRGEST